LRNANYCSGFALCYTGRLEHMQTEASIA